MKTINTCIILITAVMGLYACSGTPEHVAVEVPSIRPSMVYRHQAVREFLNQYGDQHKQMALSYAGRKETLIDKQIWNLKRSITLWPRLDGYLELGDLLMSVKQYEEAASAYQIVCRPASYSDQGEWKEVFLFGDPDLKMFGNYLAATYLAYQYLPFEAPYMAEKAGISRDKLRKQLIHDKRLDIDTSREEHKQLMLEFLTEEELAGYATNPLRFREFIHSVYNKTEVHGLEQKQTAQFNYKNFNEADWEMGPSLGVLQSYFLPEMKKNPDGWIRYNVLGAETVGDSVWLLHYAVDTSENACPPDMRHIYHVFATYTLNGEVIEAKTVGGQSGTYQGSFDFDGELLLTIEWKRTWKREYKKWDMENELIKTERVGVQLFRLDQNGHFIPAQSPAQAL